MGKHREKAATCQSTGKPQERPSLLAPWSGTSSCQNCEGRKQFCSLSPWCFVYGSPRRGIQRPIQNCLSTVLSLTPDNFLTHTHGSIYRRRLGTLGRSLDSLFVWLFPAWYTALRTLGALVFQDSSSIFSNQGDLQVLPRLSIPVRGPRNSL